MRRTLRTTGVFVGAAAVILFSILPVSPAWSARSVCPDVSSRGYISVLTINLLFSEIEDRELRLTRIADFVNQEAQLGNPIDVIALQEVVGGVLVDTDNSSIDLLVLLAGRSLKYNLRYIMVDGIPELLSVGNAILTRCSIKSTLTKTLPVESEVVFGDFQIPLKRNALLLDINVPGFGDISVYDTHLCSSCTGSERLQQARALMAFVKSAKKKISGQNPIILAGDFNTDLNMPDDVPVYNLVTDGGFVDTYAVHNGCSVCCTSPHDIGCTFAVPGDPYAFDLFSGQRELPARLDYIFAKGFGDVVESEVVFEGDSQWVSDHSGVLSRISLP